MTDPSGPILLWLRRDLRLTDNSALHAAHQTGRPVIPVFIHDDIVAATPDCPKWRWGLSIADFAGRLSQIGGRLILRRGDPLEVLRALIDETGADSVHWSRLYHPDSIARDKRVKEGLKADGIAVTSHPGHTLFEPWTVETKTGGFYKVYTPYWRAVKDRDVPAPHTAPSDLASPKTWPESDTLDDWQMGAGMQRGAEIVARHVHVGEKAAQTRLATFIRDRIAQYQTNRDIPSSGGTSGLSENLTYGEISIRACWHAGDRAMHEGKPGAETFLKELVWRDFAYHLAFHTPRLLTGNWREDWDAFPWNEDQRLAEVHAWKQGRTGIKFVDAAMREMHVTGTMHNRARMIVASYLTKHLMSHWKIGADWFAHHLIDWDPASNAMGWQWSAGSGPDATPYFRVFNPVTQLDKFDKQRTYVDRWIAEGKSNPHQDALSFYQAIPKRWAMAPSDAYPDPIVTAEDGRKRALHAYETRDF